MLHPKPLHDHKTSSQNTLFSQYKCNIILITDSQPKPKIDEAINEPLLRGLLSPDSNLFDQILP
jgi:hypothetical protein